MKNKLQLNYSWFLIILIVLVDLTIFVLSKNDFSFWLITFGVSLLLFVSILLNNPLLLDSNQSKDKKDFMAIAIHEINGPMAAIKGYLSMVLEGVSGKIDQKAKENINKAMTNVFRLDDLLNDLIDVERLSHGKISFEMQPTNISDLIINSLDKFKTQAAKKNIKITYIMPSNPLPLILIDPDKTTQLIEELIKNALKYTLKGEIKISHLIEKGRLFTLVADSGIGLATDDQKHLFEKFYRVQNEKTQDISGTGLGLWITRELVRRMDGEIFLSSKENIGSQFSIAFRIIK